MSGQVKEVIFGLQAYISSVSKGSCFHRHNDVQLGFYALGPVFYRVGKNTYAIKEGECVMCWAAIPHMVLSSPGGNIQYWTTVPLELFLEWGLPKQCTQRVLSGEMLFVGQKKNKAIDIMTFTQWAQDLTNAPVDYREIVRLSIEARFRRFCLDYMATGDRKTSSAYFEDKSAFSRICRIISDNFREKITVEDIARLTGLHPNYAMTVFKKNCGYTINTLVTMMRINEAQRLLATTKLSIVEVAFEAGFQTVSNFYAAFHKHCKKKPKEYRKMTSSPL